MILDFKSIMFLVPERIETVMTSSGEELWRKEVVDDFMGAFPFGVIWIKISDPRSVRIKVHQRNR